LEFFLDRSVTCYLVLYIQAVARLVANALCLPLLPGCPAAMTAAGARSEPALHNSAIFLNMFFIPRGCGSTDPGSPVSIKPSAGVIKPFPGR
jgi:hypothetical protein